MRHLNVRKAMAVLTIAGAAMLTPAGTAFAAAPAANDSAAGAPGPSSCVIKLVGANASDAAGMAAADRANAAATPRCFDTFAEGIAYATGGRVSLPASATTVSEARLAAPGVGAFRKGAAAVTPEAAAASTVIGIEYKDANFGGSSWIVSVSAGCAGGRAYSYSSLAPYGWNNTIGSARTYASCKSAHYQYDNFTGPNILCGCAAMGALNDLSSSIRWSESGY